MSTKQVTDMMGNRLELNEKPGRIISVVPSQTELLYHLGLDEEVIGITKFCIHPTSWFRTKMRIGGTKKLHIDKILSLNPDLIIANKEENTKDEILALAKHVPVWVSDIQTLDDALLMIKQVGALVGKQDIAENIAATVNNGFAALVAKKTDARKVAYFIWKNPWMSVGGDTFISDIITRMGWQNVAASLPRYPELTPDEAIAMGADTILLSSEPYPFGEKHIAEIKQNNPNVAVWTVDGEMFSWYGSRLIEATNYLHALRQK